MPLYNAIIFRPLTEKTDLTGQIKEIERVFHCHFREVSFKASDGKRLSAWYFEVPWPGRRS